MTIHNSAIHETELELKRLQNQMDLLWRDDKKPSKRLVSECKAKRLELIELVAEYEK